MSSLPAPVLARPATSRAVAADLVLAGRDTEFVLPASAQTLSGFRAWASSDAAPEHVRVCFLDGEVFIDMSGEELETHGQVKLQIALALAPLVKKLRLGRFFPDGTSIISEEANLSSTPDAAFVTWAAYDAGRVRFTPREGAEGQFIEVVGAVDWVLEVVSDSSVRKDLRRLRELYHRAGVREYWIIDARGGDIDFQLLRWGEEGYVEVEADRGGWRESAVFGREFRLRRRRDERGFWEYVLQVKKPG